MTAMNRADRRKREKLRSRNVNKLLTPAMVGRLIDAPLRLLHCVRRAGVTTEEDVEGCVALLIVTETIAKRAGKPCDSVAVRNMIDRIAAGDAIDFEHLEQFAAFIAFAADLLSRTTCGTYDDVYHTTLIGLVLNPDIYKGAAV